MAYLLLSLYAEKKIAPEMAELAEAQAQKHLFETVNATVIQLAEEGQLNYANMVKTVSGASGEVVYLEVNTAMLNEAKARIIERVQGELEKNKKITVSVPLGSLTGWNLFSGKGFPIRVRVYPIGMTSGDIYTVLEDCGINQTRHLIQISIKAQIMIVLSGQNQFVEYEISLPLGERVLVGEVPEIYLDSIGTG
jgi:sporulation protein YunB